MVALISGLWSPCCQKIKMKYCYWYECRKALYIQLGLFWAIEIEEFTFLFSYFYYLMFYFMFSFVLSLIKENIRTAIQAQAMVVLAHYAVSNSGPYHSLRRSVQNRAIMV